MNRQVVGFLSLFSLVLVLSVYYVVSDNDTSSTNLVTKTLDNSVSIETEDYYFSAYSAIRDQNHQEVIDEQVAIISSSESSAEEVVIAREKVSLEEEIIKAEQALEDVINQIPFNASYVEISDDLFLMKAYSSSYSEDDEIDLVLSIFEKTDAYVVSNNLSFINLENAQVEILY